MRLGSEFYRRDVLEVAPDLLGKELIRSFDDQRELRLTLTEVEAYRGEEDLACHARVGKTERTKVMYSNGGLVYMYLIYGMYWMLNVVTGKQDEPQAVLVRGAMEVVGPGRLARKLELDQSFYGENLVTSRRLWLEKKSKEDKKVVRLKRVGVEYAGDWAQKLWRWKIK